MRSIERWRVLGSAGLLAAAIACAQEPAGAPVSTSAESAWVSRYVWRGIELDRASALQSTMAVTAGSFELEVWGTQRASRALDGSRFDEVDGTLSNSGRIGSVGFTGFATRYGYPGVSSGPDTTECGFGFDGELGGVTLRSNHYFDVDAYAGSYFGELASDFAIPVARSHDLEATLSLGWANSRFNQANFGVAKSGFVCAGVELAQSFEIRKGMFVRPRLAYSRLLHPSLRAAAESPNQFVWGIAIGIAQ